MKPWELAPLHRDFWWVSIGVGVVVTFCVAILLSLLLTYIHDIRRHVNTVLEHVENAAEHTSSSPELATAATLIGALADELESHATLLSNEGPDA